MAEEKRKPSKFSITKIIYSCMHLTITLVMKLTEMKK